MRLPYHSLRGSISVGLTLASVFVVGLFIVGAMP